MRGASNGVGIWKAERAPVCERCLTPKEGPFPHEATCAGCGRGLRYRGRRPVSACSSHCAQRARRRFRKRLPLARHCTVCGGLPANAHRRALLLLAVPTGRLSAAPGRLMTHEVRPEWAVGWERLGWLEQAQELSENQIAIALGINPRNGATRLGERELPIPLAGELRRRYGCTLDWLYLGEEHANSEGFNSDWPKRDAPPRTGTGAVAAPRHTRALKRDCGHTVTASNATGPPVPARKSIRGSDLAAFHNRPRALREHFRRRPSQLTLRERRQPRHARKTPRARGHGGLDKRFFHRV